MSRRSRHQISKRGARFSKPALLGVGLAVLILVAVVLLSSDGSLSTGFATLGKSIGSSLASLDGKEPVSLTQSPTLPEVALRSPQPAGTRRYIYGKGLAASKSADGTMLYYHQDALGSNRVVTNDNAEIQSKSVAYPYGEPVEQVGFSTKQSRYTFTGKELDSKLYYYAARYYNPRTMRFASVDPIPGAGSAYEYAASNPLKFVDPTGMRFYFNGKVDNLVTNDKYVSKELSYFDRTIVPIFDRGHVSEQMSSDIRTMIENGDLLIANDYYSTTDGKVTRLGGSHFSDRAEFSDVLVKGDFGIRNYGVFLKPYEGGGYWRGTLVRLAINGGMKDVHVADTILHEYCHYLQPPDMSSFEKEQESYGVSVWLQLFNGRSMKDLTPLERATVFGSSNDFKREAEKTGLYKFIQKPAQESENGNSQIVDPPPLNAQGEQIA